MPVKLYLLMCALVASVAGEEDGFAYQKSVLIDLCKYIGVQYVRNPDNPVCGYIACWARNPYNMPCAPGLKVHPLFFWGESYPCTEKDKKDQCTYIEKFIKDRRKKAATYVAQGAEVENRGQAATNPEEDLQRRRDELDDAQRQQEATGPGEHVHERNAEADDKRRQPMRLEPTDAHT